MGDDILQMIVCLRDGKEAVEQLNLKAIYPDEAKNVALRVRPAQARATQLPLARAEGLARVLSHYPP